MFLTEQIENSSREPRSRHDRRGQLLHEMFFFPFFLLSRTAKLRQQLYTHYVYVYCTPQYLHTRLYRHARALMSSSCRNRPRSTAHDGRRVRTIYISLPHDTARHDNNTRYYKYVLMRIKSVYDDDDGQTCSGNGHRASVRFVNYYEFTSIVKTTKSTHDLNV